MIRDADAIFTKEGTTIGQQTITNDAEGGNVLDLLVADLNIGRGVPIYGAANVGETFTSSTNPTDLVVNIVESASADLSAPTTLLTKSIPKADLSAGAVFNLGALPQVTKRYLGVTFGHTGGGSWTAGTIEVGLELDQQDETL